MRSCLGWDPEIQEGKVYSIWNPRPLLNTCGSHRETFPPEDSQSRELSFLAPIRAWNLNNFLFLGRRMNGPASTGVSLGPYWERKVVVRWPGPKWSVHQFRGGILTPRQYETSLCLDNHRYLHLICQVQKWIVVGVCICVVVGGRQMFLSTALHLSSWGKVLLNPELANLTSLVSKLVSDPCLCLQTAGVPGVLLYLSDLFVGAQRLNSGLYAWLSSTH